MKNKIIAIMSIVLVISIGLNFYFFLNLSENKKLIANADEQISDLQEQLSDLEKLQQDLTDLQTQLTDSKEEIKELENQLDKTISDNNTTFQGNGNGVDVLIPDDFPYVDRGVEEEVIETPAPEIVEQPKVEQPKQEVQQPVQTSAPVNSMPTRTDGGGVPSAPTGTGDGNGGSTAGMVGTFE